MPIPNRPRFNSHDPRFVYLQTDDGSYTLEDVASGNTFHSGCGAVTECAEVYANNSGVVDLLRNKHHARVLELGFGTSLACVVTLAFARQLEARIEYVSIERSPLDHLLIKGVLERSQHVSPLSEKLVQEFLEVSSPSNEINLGDHRRITLSGPSTSGSWAELELLCNDVSELGNLLASESLGLFDAVYFDPFDPISNPEAWTLPVFERMHQLLHPGGRLVSYCVKSEVRRQLALVGFDVHRVQGPVGGKREVLMARKRPSSVCI